jgi:hypothetical protein
MYLSYSGFGKFRECALSYFHSYVAKTPLGEPDNRVNMLYGSVVGTVFEHFYNDKIFLRPGSEAALMALVEPTMNKTILQEQAKGGVFNWNAPKLKYKSRDQVAREVREAIPRGLATIRLHRLIGYEAAAEVKLDGKVEGHTIGGRADFIIRRVKPHGDLVLLDGKGSRYREQYVSANQLKWYAFLHKLKFGVPPDKLGFVFWRFEPDSALQWVEFSDADLDDLRQEALEAIHDIERGTVLWEKSKALPDAPQRLQEAFPAAPSSQCKLCSYLSLCSYGRSISTNRFSVPEQTGVGVEDIGLD